MSTYSLDNFKAEINRSGIAWTDRFEVIISPPQCISESSNTVYDHSGLISLYAEQVSLPSLILESKRLQIYGPSSPRPIGINYGGDGLNITFLLDEKMNVKTMFDFWIQSVVSGDSFLVAYQDTYTCDIRIRQLDKNDNIMYEVLIQDAYPFSTQNVDLNNSAQNSAGRLNVAFAYRKWKNIALPDFGANASQVKRNSDVQVTVLG